MEGGSVRGLDPSTRGLLAAPLSGRCSVGEPPRPSFGRDGLHLGEAAVLLLLLWVKLGWGWIGWAEHEYMCGSGSILGS